MCLACLGLCWLALKLFVLCVCSFWLPDCVFVCVSFLNCFAAVLPVYLLCLIAGVFVCFVLFLVCVALA